MLNNQFSSVFTNEDTSNIPQPEGKTSPDIDRLIIDTNGITKLLQKLNPNKAAGPDALSTRLLKETAIESAPILQKIFQKSIDSGELPKDWKMANIAPVYKKENRCIPSNYRPVSLTSVTCKLLEHVVNRHIMNHLDNHNILVDNQHGFRSRRSCETQLVLTSNDLAAELDKSGQVDMLVLDFSKAFDTVPHQRLIAKLKQHGISGNILNWINSFLTNRTQCVVVDGHKSNPAPVCSGVPQGTVLGPLLFLVYINDLAKKTTSSVRLFADDCVMYRRINNSADCNALQDDLNSLHDWEKTWLMSFNAKKCHVLRVTHARARKIFHDYKLGESVLKPLPSHGYLGVEIADDLKWNCHVGITARKANQTLGVVRRNLKHCPSTIKEKAYKSVVRPKLEYASSIWDPYTKNNIKILEAVQRRAARFVCNTYSRESSVTAMINKLEWPLLEQRRAESRLVMLHRIINEAVDIACDDLVARSTSTRGHTQRLNRIQCKKDCYKYSFIPRTIVQWNNLPPDIVQLHETKTFRKSLNTIDLTLNGSSYHY